jgi:enamine deaminase RidA (YjgF/YER057c/UK114 family)
MLLREHGEIDSGIFFSLTEESYSGYSIINININVPEKAIRVSSAKSIVDFLFEREYSILFALHFTSGDIPPQSESEKYCGYLNNKIPVLALRRSLNGDSVLHLVCTDSKKVEDICSSVVNGKILKHNDINLFYINSVISVQDGLSNYLQAYNSFTRLKADLEKSGLSFSDVSRTWIYVNNILNWYDKLNQARDAFFSEEGVFDSFVPSSTGIGSANYLQRDVVIAAMGYSGSGSVEIEMLDSPLQCAALDYRSSFSRAVKVTSSNISKLIISGTASIDANGKTEFTGNVKQQIIRTFEVVEAILSSNGMAFEDSSRSIAYFPSVDLAASFDEISLKFGLDPVFVTKVIGTVCRGDLLFELELDACRCIK